MLPTLLIVRHGESAHNEAGMFCGLADSVLTDRGRYQMQCLATKVAAYPVSRVFCSDLARARESAAILASENRWPITLDPRLRELHSYERKEKSVLGPHEWATQVTGKTCSPTVQIAECFRQITSSDDFGCSLVVTHSGTLRIALEYLLNLEPGGGALFRRPNGTLNVLTKLKGQWRVEIWGEQAVDFRPTECRS